MCTATFRYRLVVLSIVLSIVISSEARSSFRNLTEAEILNEAILLNDRDHVEVLLREGIDPNTILKDDNPALVVASVKQHNSIVNLFIQAGANVNLANKNTGITALMAASTNCVQNTSAAKILLKAGANIDARDERGRNPLMLAVTAERRDNMDAIGNEAPALDETENSSLDDVSTTNEYAHIVKRLCQNGANINYQDKEGWTALMLASYFGKEAMTEVLLSAGADAELKNKDGSTALMLARQHNHISVESSLLAWKRKLFGQTSILGVIICLSVWISAHYITRPEDKVQEIGINESNITKRMVLNMDDITLFPTPLKSSPYSKVYRGTYRNTNIVLKFNSDPKIQSSELDLLLSLRHPRILILLGVVKAPHQSFDTSWALVTEFMPRGSLYDVLHSNDTPDAYKLKTLQSKLRVLLDVADGMEFLHARDVLHRDLKSPNVLIDKKGRAKIGDFGISKMLEPNMTCATAIVGTHAWASPEALLQNEGVRKSTDVYSFGVILWEMLANEIPWRDVPGSQVIINVSQGKSLPIPASSEDEFEQQLVAMLVKCLNRNQDLRPLFSNIAANLRNLLPQCVKREHRQRTVDECPAQYKCPITHTIMNDPVICSDGHTYERESIERWFDEHDTSPNTNVPLSDKSLRPNITLRSLISDYRATIADRN